MSATAPAVPVTTTALHDDQDRTTTHGALPLVASLYVTQYLGVGFIYVGISLCSARQSSQEMKRCPLTID